MIDKLVALLERPLAVPDAVAGAVVERRDAIVVLGALLTPTGALTPIVEERVRAAAALYRAGAAPLVVASGGITQGAPCAEAEAVAEALRGRGVPDVLLETRSSNTAENARFTAELLAARRARTVWLVTQPFHGKRAALLFRRAGLEPRVWHIADSIQYRDRKRAARWLVREYGAWGLLFLRDLGLRRAYARRRNT